MHKSRAQSRSQLRAPRVRRVVAHRRRVPYARGCDARAHTSHAYIFPRVGSFVGIGKTRRPYVHARNVLAIDALASRANGIKVPHD